jgi:DNA-binding NtrC family response regulator
MTIPKLDPFLPGGVLVASANSSLRERVRHSLHDQSRPVQEATGGADALIKLESGSWQLLFLDRRLPDLDAEELVQIIKRRFPGTEVVVLDSDSAQALPLGTWDGNAAQRWVRPLPTSDTNRSKTQDDEIARPESPAGLGRKCLATPLPGMIGETEAMQRLYRLARLVAPTVTTVLVTGATGTGKELVAQGIHKLSPRAARAFVVVNCAAIPESLLESELFGHIRGAFTGAVQFNPGRISAAQGGTLFLDEVGELPLSLQAKLLRFLDQKEIQRLGTAEVVRADVRIVAATNADLGQAVDEGRFRGDLYYRLSAFPLELPPLSERIADVAPIARHFLHVLTPAAYGHPPTLSMEVIHMLESHHWQGNVRELQQVIERAVILANGEPAILPDHIYFPARGRSRSLTTPANVRCMEA